VRVGASDVEPARRRGRRLAWRVTSVALASLVVAALGPAPARAFADTSTAPAAPYIVRAGTTTDLRHQVELHHGQIRKQLADGVVAVLTSNDARDLSLAPGVDVSPNTPVALSTLTGLPHDATTAFTTVTGADPLVAAGIDGRGVTVAVLDTGIDQSPDFGSRLIGGVDLTGEGNPFQDDYGHGTFVAGLIAGDGTASMGQYKGEAPGANLVAIKVAGANGAVDTATVIQGIDWAIANEERYAIRVLNLSLGADATESTTTAPLDAAVERAWEAGIVVVASAGNYGPGNGSISKPGDDPLIITTGATDNAGTASPLDDTVPAFSSVGPTWADGWFKPDLVVPGRSVVSVRAPLSTVDRTYPSAQVGSDYFRGSGTSFSSAIMSGAAALVLEANASAQPDEVKGRVLATAAPGPVGNPFVDGHGVLDVSAAASVEGIHFSQANAVHAIRSGPRKPARGAVHQRVDLATTWASSTWNPAAWAGTSRRLLSAEFTTPSSKSGRVPGYRRRTGRSSWSGSSWNGSSWSGSSWNGSSWSGSSWNGSSWSGSSWSGSSWNGSSWSGSSWSGSSWSGSSWSRYQWS
jgi:serine protease AprX